MYHDVYEPEDGPDSSGFPGATAARYKLSTAAFRAHLDALVERGVETTLTFDDGGASASRIADELEARGMRGHFFVTTGRIDAPGFLSAAGVGELARRGHVVGGHGHEHPSLMGRLPREQIGEEWRRSRDRLGEILGAAPTSASVPGGYFARPVAEEAEAAGYSLLMTSEPRSRPARVGGIEVQGRYAMRSGDSAARAVALAEGDLAPRAAMRATWVVKRLAKTAAPGGFDRLRRWMS